MVDIIQIFESLRNEFLKINKDNLLIKEDNPKSINRIIISTKSYSIAFYNNFDHIKIVECTGVPWIFEEQSKDNLPKQRNRILCKVKNNELLVFENNEMTLEEFAFFWKERLLRTHYHALN